MGNNKHRLKVIAHIGIDYIYIWVKMRTRMSMYVGTIVAYLYSVVAGDSSPMPPTPLKKKMRMWGTSATVCKWGYSQKGYSLVFSERHASKARIIMVHISHYPLHHMRLLFIFLMPFGQNSQLFISLSSFWPFTSPFLYVTFSNNFLTSSKGTSN